jgi:hypothetical protein
MGVCRHQPALYTKWDSFGNQALAACARRKWEQHLAAAAGGGSARGGAASRGMDRQGSGAAEGRKGHWQRRGQA